MIIYVNEGKKQENSSPSNLHDYLRWGTSDELITSFCKILTKILAACLKRSFMQWLCFTSWFIHGWQIINSISNQDGMDTHKSDGCKEFSKNSYSNTFLRNFYSTKINCSWSTFQTSTAWFELQDDNRFPTSTALLRTKYLYLTNFSILTSCLLILVVRKKLRHPRPQTS